MTQILIYGHSLLHTAHCGTQRAYVREFIIFFPEDVEWRRKNLCVKCLLEDLKRFQMLLGMTNRLRISTVASPLTIIL